MKHTSRILFFSLIMLAAIARADEAKRGRLADGTAYRVDAQGMELVDYTAELEVQIDELKRRVHGLQFELEEKEDIISALKARGAKEPVLTERDLLSGQPPQEEPNPPVAVQPQHCIETENQMTALRNQNEKLQKQLIVKTSLAKSYQRSIAELETAARAECKVPEVDSDVACGEQTELIALQQKNELLAEQLNKYKQKTAEATRASLARNTPQQLSTARSELQTRFNHTKGTISERDKRFHLFRQSNNTTAKVGQSAPRSKRGVHINQIPSKIQGIQSLTEAGEIRKDLKDITTLMKKDMRALAHVESER